MTLTKSEWFTCYLAWVGCSAGGVNMLREASQKTGLTHLVGMALGFALIFCALLVAGLMTYAVLHSKEAK